MVGSIPPMENYDRYRRLVWCIVTENQSISTIQVDSYEKKRSTVDIDRRSRHTLKKSVDVEFAFTYFIIPTDQNDWFGRSLLFTVTNYKRFSLNNTHTERDHDGTETRVCKVGVDCEWTFSYVLSECPMTPTPTPALANQRCKKNSTVQRLVPVITLIATASKWFCRLYVTCSCCLELPYITPSEKTKNNHWPMVPKVMKYGPRQASTKKLMFPTRRRGGAGVETQENKKIL